MRSEGQSIMEYAILLGVVVAAVLGMQVYAKRGIQAGVKMAADVIGPQHKGIEDIDLNLIWVVKGNAQLDTTKRATNTLDTALGGSVSRTTNEAATNTGTLSFNLFAEPDQ